MSEPRVVLVTDWITQVGGGEKVVEQFHKLYPDAPIYTSYCSPEWQARLNNKVITGYLQRWPLSKLRRFLPVLRQRWFGKLDLKDFDVVISITGNGEAKFVKTSPKQTHICYCHTPVHFYWAQYNEYIKNPSMRPKWLARLGLKVLVKPLRKRDYAAAQKVDYFIANSSSIRADIKKYYQKDSAVVFPPIDTDQFLALSSNKETRVMPKLPHCIWWGRVVPAKRLDIAIEACNQLKLPLTVIGNGPILEGVKKIAGPTITFAGYVSDQKRNELIEQADLFLFPSKEDFGVAPVEALAAGLPVIAYGAGGALDYIEEGQNGKLFDAQASESLAQAIEATYDNTFRSVSGTAQKFSSEKFRARVNSFVIRVLTN